MTTLTTRTTLAALAGLSLVGALAGCSAESVTAVDPAPADVDPATGSSTPGTYADGTYTSEGTYTAPSGTEHVDVTITLSGDLITAVEVVGDATDPTARLRQGEFISGIAGVVVGKDLDSIQVDKVGGSSLTSGGFNKAIDEIKADAVA
ncbi:MAG: hypothetical protein Q8M65_05440 [Rhodoglobus sp.]|nr:hypothetical protein [Rhodoglobus sp.]